MSRPPAGDTLPSPSAASRLRINYRARQATLGPTATAAERDAVYVSGALARRWDPEIRRLRKATRRTAA